MSDNKDNHGFSVSVAQEIGVNRAIMLQHFRHLQIAFVDGEKSATDIWVKRSRRALTETYPYLSEKEIRGCLDRLERDDYIRAKVDNALNYDRTKSYQLSKKGWELLGLPASAQKANREQKASDKRANGLDKRANDKVTKGPMNIGSCSSIVTSIVECEKERFAPTAPEPQNLKVEEKESPKVAQKGSFEVTAIASPTDMPGVTMVEAVPPLKRANTILDAEKKILDWATGDGLATIAMRHGMSKRHVPEDLAPLVAHYVSVYASTNEGSRASLLRDPVAHFESGLYKYLTMQNTIDRNNQPGNQSQVRNQEPPANFKSQIRH